MPRTCARLQVCALARGRDRVGTLTILTTHATLASSPSFAAGDRDLFALLGEAVRPAYRWLIAGPKRSGASPSQGPRGRRAEGERGTGPRCRRYVWGDCGRMLLVAPGSSWHVDPNATSAWNGLLTGKKRWIFCPPGTTPPGVFPRFFQWAVCLPCNPWLGPDGYLLACQSGWGCGGHPNVHSGMDDQLL